MNNLYFLLQNSRQVGPYTQQDLMQIGIRPTDLVWIQGKSTTWQTAEAVEELRILLKPAVTPCIDKVVTAAAASSQDMSAPQVCNSKVSEDSVPLSHIYVRFPVSIQETLVEERDIKIVDQSSQSVVDKIAAPCKTKSTEEIFPDSSQYRSIDEIRKEYASWVKQHEPKSQNRKVNKPLIALFFGITTLLMFVLNWNKTNKKTSALENTTDYYHVEGVHEKIKPSALPGMRLTGLEATSRMATSKEPDVNFSSKMSNQTNAELTKQNDQVKNENTEGNLPVVEASPAVVSNTESTHAEERDIAVVSAHSPGTIQATIPQDAASNEKQSEPSPPLTTMVDVKSNYVANKKEGITSFNVTINNRSNKLLTLVAVDVLYYKANKELIGKKTLYFSNVKPGAEIKQDVAANNLAVVADCRLGLISNGEAITYNKQ